MIQEYLGGLCGGFLSPQQSLAVSIYCLWMATAQGNGPLSRAHLGAIPAKVVIHKEMVSGNVPMGRTCSGFPSRAQLLQGLGRARRLAVSLLVSIHEQPLLPRAFWGRKIMSHQ